MVIGVILGFLFVGVIAAMVFLIVRNKKLSSRGKNSKSDKTVKKNNIVYAAVAAVSFVLFLLFPFSLHTVQAGEVAVVKVWGQAKHFRTAGTYFDFWLSNQYQIYDTKEKTIDSNMVAYSSDAQSMTITMSVIYRIQAENAVEIANNYGAITSIEKKIEVTSLEKAKAVFSTENAMNIITKRGEVLPKIETMIREAITPEYYSDIIAVRITNIDFSKAFEQTVEDKMIAEQEKLKAEFERETAIIKAEQDLEVAKLAAQAELARAEAEAEAQLIIAKVQAQAIKLKSIEVARMLGFTITETALEDSIEYNIDFTGKSDAEIKLITDYLKYIEYLEKWNGELPGVLVTDGSASIIIPTP